MRFLIGTTNKAKINTAEAVIRNITGSTDFTIEGVPADSSVPETPHEEEIKQGAVNRAQILCSNSGADFYIGLESGLTERYGDIYEEVWCCVMTATQQVYGYSSGLRVPKVITDRMKTDNLKHYEVMRLLRDELSQPNDRDTWGNYSHKMLIRSAGFEEAIRNALIPLFAPKESLYHL